MDGGVAKPPLLLLDLAEDKHTPEGEIGEEKSRGKTEEAEKTNGREDEGDVNAVHEGKLVDLVQEAEGSLTKDAPREEEDSEDELRVVQEQRTFCAAGPDCSILDAEHYVTYRHTALNKKERMQMEEMKAQEANKDKKAGGRWMDFLSRRKATAEKEVPRLKEERDKRNEKDREEKEKEKEKNKEEVKEKDTEKPGTTTNVTILSTSGSAVPTSTSPARGGSFTLKKIFGKKGENEATPDEPAANAAPAALSASPPRQGVVLPSPILSQAPTDIESPPPAAQAAAPSGEGGPDRAEPSVSWMARKRTVLTDKIGEIKKKLQESSLSGVGEEAATEEQVSERLASFKAMVEELDQVGFPASAIHFALSLRGAYQLTAEQLEKELEQVLVMGDSFYVWQSQKRRLVEITAQGQVVACDLIYQSPFANEWGPLSQQVNFKGSLLSSGPSYAFCKVKLVTKDGRLVDSLKDASSCEDLVFEVKLANAIRYVDEIKSFGVADKSTPRKNADNVPGGMGFKIEWKNGSREQWHAEDGEGLDRVMSYHLRAYGLRRAKQVGRLRGLWCLACTPYDSADKQHEGELMALWQAVWPDVQLTDRVSAQWKQLGFQGNDPATDFRGMGLLGLTTILYFARHYADALSYPWASTGINLTQMLFKSLKLDEPLIRAADTSEQWDTPLFQFMTTKDNEEERNLFEEVFCQCFLLFDRIWVSSNAGYMDFPIILNKVSHLFEEILQQRPTNIADLHRRQQLAGDKP